MSFTLVPPSMAAMPSSAAQLDTTATVVADEVAEDDSTVLRGHGIQLRNGMLVATVCGLVQRVNKLVTVQAWRHRYRAEVGDVVVGRVTEASGKRWRIDLAAQIEAALLLSAVNLPGGVQRRRTAEDELNMRSVFQEGDLLTAEVQAVHHDGSIMLHTRSNKYGRLHGGMVLSVPSALVKRQKQHFVSLQGSGVDVVLGCNGMIWVAPAASSSAACEPPTVQQAESASRVAQAVKVLTQLNCAITPASVMAVWQLSQGTPAHHMTSQEFCAGVLAAHDQLGVA